jgi:hypothetical protein
MSRHRGHLDLGEAVAFHRQHMETGVPVSLPRKLHESVLSTWRDMEAMLKGISGLEKFKYSHSSN